MYSHRHARGRCCRFHIVIHDDLYHDLTIFQFDAASTVPVRRQFSPIFSSKSYQLPAVGWHYLSATRARVCWTTEFSSRHHLLSGIAAFFKAMPPSAWRLVACGINCPLLADQSPGNPLQCLMPATVGYCSFRFTAQFIGQHIGSGFIGYDRKRSAGCSNHSKVVAPSLTTVFLSKAVH